jgi:16S rRNA (guanine966-N2)-methyltransferase
VKRDPERVRSAGAGSRRGSAGSPPVSSIRIVGGRWKRTPIPVVDAEGLRPTPDRVRETLFNWLGQDLTGWRCLDLFAGTGALGFEAASRGAARVVMVERAPRALAALEAVRERLDAHAVQIVKADALAWLAACRERFDLVLLDPPFGGDALARALPAVASVLEPEGRIYVESPHPLSREMPPLRDLPGFTVHRAARAGQVHYHLLLPESGA